VPPPEPGTVQLEAGRLLVAAPALLDPNFVRSVVLMLDHDHHGALGVVLNRPSPVPVADVLPNWAQSARPPDVLFHGGPVGTDSALAVASLAGDPEKQEEPAEPVGWQRMFGRTGIVDLDAPPELVSPAVTGIRVFAGYAGWGQEQLEAEIAEGSWYVVPSQPGDVYDTDPGTLWARVLRRQPGELAWLSTRPLDPTQN
jgi:putative transcriptional regulator